MSSRRFGVAGILGALMGIGALSSGCRPTDYLYYARESHPQIARYSHKLKEVVGQNKLDLLWIIDNSGSMAEHQANVIANSARFMSAFIKPGYIDWRIGLITTDVSDSPYLGLLGAPRLDAKTPGPVAVFQGAVAQLGTNGSATEKTFEPVLQALTADPGFLRKDAMLALMLVTDAEEQSAIDASEFLTRLSLIRRLDSVVLYGALGSRDFGCPPSDSYWDYSGSPYEEVVEATHGKVFALCDPAFGQNLAQISQDIVSRLENPKILLELRPKPSSIRIYYKGKLLPGGPKESGGFWIYDFDLNAIVFHDLSFAPGDNEEVEVEMLADDGTQ